MKTHIYIYLFNKNSDFKYKEIQNVSSAAV